ncbi:glycosyltransferase family 2 protein [Sphingobacterium faecium]
MNNSKLAIIIPAYKAEYLEATLASLQKQTDSRFTIYVGDDCSPYDLKTIVNQFSDKIDIIYHRFNENMGGISLTKQWERCVSLSQEEWIWLFSDDDIVEKNAVEVFYNSFDESNLLYKFHTKIIDEKGNLNPYYSKFDRLNNLEDYISSDDFISSRLQSKGFRSFAVEYVFHRSLFFNKGFIDFPLAWNSDDATWLTYSIANSKRIRVLNTYVYWRLSTTNITSDTKSKAVIKQKMEASILYIEWLNKVVTEHSLEVKKYMFLRWFSIQMSIFIPQISISDFYKRLRKLSIPFSNTLVPLYFFRYVKLQGLKRNLQGLLKLKK